ncbi:MAG: hypothetical protein ACRD2E_02990 [Terriglobales bacterium]
MTEPNDHSLSWKEIADLCRRQLEPEDIRRLDIEIWREIHTQMAYATAPPEQLAKAGVTGLLRLPTRPRA